MRKIVRNSVKFLLFYGKEKINPLGQVTFLPYFAGTIGATGVWPGPADPGFTVKVYQINPGRDYGVIAVSGSTAPQNQTSADKTADR